MSIQMAFGKLQISANPYSLSHVRDSFPAGLALDIV